MWFVLFGFNTAFVIAILASIFYGVGVFQAIPLFIHDSTNLLIIIPWVMVCLVITQWMFAMVRRPAPSPGAAVVAYPFIRVLLAVGLATGMTWFIQYVQTMFPS